jgi:hypothetical protein
MSKKELDVIAELKRSALSSEKVVEHSGQAYAIAAGLYALANGDPEINKMIDSILHYLGLDYQEFLASQARVEIMGAAIQQKNATIEELTQEARKLAKLWNDHIAAEPIPVFTNGHRKNGRRA